MVKARERRRVSSSASTRNHLFESIMNRTREWDDRRLLLMKVARYLCNRWKVTPTFSIFTGTTPNIWYMSRGEDGSINTVLDVWIEDGYVHIFAQRRDIPLNSWCMFPSSRRGALGPGLRRIFGRYLYSRPRICQRLLLCARSPDVAPSVASALGLREILENVCTRLDVMNPTDSSMDCGHEHVSGGDSVLLSQLDCPRFIRWKYSLRRGAGPHRHRHEALLNRRIALALNLDPANQK